MSLSDIKILIGIITGILSIIGYFTGFFKWIYQKIHKSKHNKVPKKSIIIVNSSNEHDNFWHIGNANGTPMLQLAAKFVVTNITDKPIILVHSSMKIYKGYGTVQVKDLNSIYWGSYPIPPGKTTQASIHFFIPLIKGLKDQVQLEQNIALIDQFNNKHWIKKVKFRAA